jgi:3-methyl-2-oxobutanoate hydroxymethyltransferase
LHSNPEAANNANPREVSMSYVQTDPGSPVPVFTVASLMLRKRGGPKLAMLTAYDASIARAAEQAGIDILLVGDSLGMVVQGHASTLPVRIDDVVYHCAAVARVTRRALVMADMPFASAPDPATAFRNAARLVGEGGAAMVKLEGAGHMLESIRYLVERDVPVCAHLGLTPQSVLRLGGFKVQGREQEVAERLREDARAVVAAGASALVLECVPAALAAAITAQCAIPTIGIGAGADCDGQVLVCFDLLGLGGGRRPRFVRDFLDGRGSIDAAIRAYVDAVRSGEFPSASESYQ